MDKRKVKQLNRLAKRRKHGMSKSKTFNSSYEQLRAVPGKGGK